MSDLNTSSSNSAPIESANSNDESSSAPLSNESSSADSGDVGVVDASGNLSASQPKITNPGPGSPQAQQQKPQQAPRKMKLKVDGREEELAEDEVLKWAQMGRASQKRFQEAAQMRKQAEEFISLLKKDPRSVLQNPAIGVDLRKFAEEYLSEQLKLETLSPEQRRVHELEQQLKQIEQQRQQDIQQRQAEENQRLQEHFAQEYDKKMTEALQTSGLPKTPYTVKRMAEYLSLALENGIELEPSNVIEMVRADYMTDALALFSQTDGDTLIKLLGDGVANKIRKADLARLKSQQARQAITPIPEPEEPVAAQEPAPQAAAPKPSRPKADPNRKLNIHEWREMMDRKVRGK